MAWADLALKVAAETNGDAVLVWEDGEPRAVFNRLHVMRATLLVNTLKWRAAKQLPHVFGDRLTLAGDAENPMQVSHRRGWVHHRRMAEQPAIKPAHTGPPPRGNAFSGFGAARRGSARAASRRRGTRHGRSAERPARRGGAGVFLTAVVGGLAGQSVQPSGRPKNISAVHPHRTCEI